MSKSELKEYYLASDIFVLPTRSDVWGLVINEAMACGLPVITTDRCVAGMDLIKDGENGYVVHVDDVNAFAKKCNLILNDNELKTVMSSNNLEKIRYYTVENMAKIHFDVFNDILKK